MRLLTWSRLHMQVDVVRTLEANAVSKQWLQSHMAPPEGSWEGWSNYGTHKTVKARWRRHGCPAAQTLFGVSASGITVEGLKLRVSGLWFRFGFGGSEFKVQGLGLRIYGFGFGIWYQG